MTATTLRATRTGTVGAYLTSGDLDVVNRVRAQAGRVTLSGKAGLRTLNALAKLGDVANVDLDPATYLGVESDGELFPIDWVAQQRQVGLDVVRSEGLFARRGDPQSLKDAFSTPVGRDVVRVVSFAEFWLKRQNVQTAVAAVRSCEDQLAFVFAALFDPLESVESVESLQILMAAASAGERRVELLRTDTHAIPFAIHGGSQAAIGLTSTGRHHAQPMNRRIREEFERRQRSQSLWVPGLMGWQQGAKLGALSPFGGTGLTDCECSGCAGGSLLRFAKEYSSIPKAVREDAHAHDVSSWVSLRNRILGASDPHAEWRAACASAQRVEAGLVEQYKVSALTAPRSLRVWG